MTPRRVCACVRVQTDIEISKEEDFARILQMEEEYIQQICEDIIRLRPDLVFTEKGISGTLQLSLTLTHTHIHTHSHEDVYELSLLYFYA